MAPSLEGVFIWGREALLDMIATLIGMIRTLNEVIATLISLIVTLKFLIRTFLELWKLNHPTKPPFTHKTLSYPSPS